MARCEAVRVPVFSIFRADFANRNHNLKSKPCGTVDFNSSQTSAFCDLNVKAKNVKQLSGS